MERNLYMNPLKIGVIGTGHMGKNHVRNILEERRFELVGIYDKDERQSTEVADKYSVKRFEGLDKLLESVDAVIVAVPSSLHKEIGLKAAEYGVHALIEKPLATNSVDAQIIAEAFKQKGLKLAVGHIERFNPVFKELHKLAENSDIFYIEACRYSPFSSSGRIVDVSVIEDLMIHDVDLVCNLMGGIPIVEIYGMGGAVKSHQADFATCVLKFAGTAHAVVNASRISQNKERTIDVHTADSCIRADLIAKTLYVYKNTDMTIDVSHDNSYKQEGLVQKIYVPIQEPLRGELIAFYEAVAKDAPIVVDGMLGVKAIEICEEVTRQLNIQG